MPGVTRVEYAAGDEQRRRVEKADGTPCESGADAGIKQTAEDLPTILRREQYRSLTRLVPILYAVVIVATAMLAYGLRSAGPAWLQIWLPSAIACVCVLRFRYWISVRKHVADQDIRIIERDIRATSILGPAMSFGFTLEMRRLVCSQSSTKPSLSRTECIIFLWTSFGIPAAIWDSPTDWRSSLPPRASL